MYIHDLTELPAKNTEISGITISLSQLRIALNGITNLDGKRDFVAREGATVVIEQYVKSRPDYFQRITSCAECLI